MTKRVEMIVGRRRPTMRVTRPQGLRPPPGDTPAGGVVTGDRPLGPAGGMAVEGMPVKKAVAHGCGICGRPLDLPGDPLSQDCGGDCWGCVSEAEWPGAAAPGQSLEEYRAAPSAQLGSTS
jgi:hypothetical protein